MRNKRNDRLSYIFICGCGHTGSSIIARVLGEHSDVYFVPMESGVFLANRYFIYKEMIRDFEFQAKNLEKHYILEKTPRHIWHVDYIRRVCKGARFILTVRYGYDVIASLYERIGSVEAAIQRYRDDSVLTLRQSDMDDVIFFSYDDFIENPITYMSETCHFLGIKYEPQMLDYHKNKINWNLDNPFVGPNGNDEHNFKRNQQVNSPLEKTKKIWKDRIPIEYHEMVNNYFSSQSEGYEIETTLVSLCKKRTITNR